MKRSSRPTGVQIDARVDTLSVLPANPDFLSVAETAHIQTRIQVLRDLGSSQDNGLTNNDASRRLTAYGENVLIRTAKVSAWNVLFGQLANALTLVLIAALALSFGVKDFIEGAVIAAVIVLNTTVGFFQEYKAEKTMDSLRQLSSPTAYVIRDGESIAIPAKDVVHGDIILIKAGDVVPSDVSIISLKLLWIHSIKFD
ncbi:hypothetical protein M422DRAFT_180761 [Sphaerobolus stellatus SS14]|uniref:Cation-transporting P-type ATPase N-terminal domain-containing protein n=1 Tax=Sphaerobolus stellatus (strain SS14) TaxID=990650 RepID=A0A0C9VDP1_SPHS4|nr:hypothetical protein M422DRAFT_180761 [Sphaerobolus stellatus SS14]